MQEITAERWWYTLEVLPPVMWCHRGGGERFPMMEHIAGSIVNIYVRIGKRFFHFADHAWLKPEERVARVEAWLIEKAWKKRSETAA